MKNRRKFFTIQKKKKWGAISFEKAFSACLLSPAILSRINWLFPCGCWLLDNIYEARSHSPSGRDAKSKQTPSKGCVSKNYILPTRCPVI
jgi:hypothetical protein